MSAAGPVALGTALGVSVDAPTDRAVSRIAIYVDGDACPVKQEVYRVAARYRLAVKLVANSYIAVPDDPLIERVVVSDGFDAADNWIAERATRGDIW